jgi:hypothetical protein
VTFLNNVTSRRYSRDSTSLHAPGSEPTIAVNTASFDPPAPEFEPSPASKSADDDDSDQHDLPCLNSCNASSTMSPKNLSLIRLMCAIMTYLNSLA